MSTKNISKRRPAALVVRKSQLRTGPLLQEQTASMRGATNTGGAEVLVKTCTILPHAPETGRKLRSIPSTAEAADMPATAARPRDGTGTPLRKLRIDCRRADRARQPIATSDKCFV